MMPRLIKKAVWIALVGLISASAYSRSFSSPYHFYAPDFNNLLPFPATYRPVIKEHKIKNVSLVLGETRTVHFFDEEGRLLSSRFYKIRGKKERETGWAKYLYNKENQLLSARKKQEGVEHFDTLAYDALGRVSYYYSCATGITKRGIYVRYRMKPFQASDTYVLLMDSSQTCCEPRYFTLDNQNCVVKITDGDAVDSIHTLEVNGVLTLRQYWFKLTDTADYHLGKEEIYENGYIQKENIYDKYTHVLLEEIGYLYDDQNRLLRRMHKNIRQDKTFYVYDGTGLPYEEIRVGRNDISIIRYAYSYK